MGALSRKIIRLAFVNNGVAQAANTNEWSVWHLRGKTNMELVCREQPLNYSYREGAKI
jgi:hypothetical protein